MSSTAVERPVAKPMGWDWPEVARLVEVSAATVGHVHTLREILQQPATWQVTAHQLANSQPEWLPALNDLSTIILTGSGSSEYVGNCLTASFQRRLGITAEAIGSGTLLTNAAHLLPAKRPALMVSFARSGDSPESAGALFEVIHADAAIRQLVLTCNPNGNLARKAETGSSIYAILLDSKTNDRSLVMTSSFTNMVLAGLALAWSKDIDGYITMADALVKSGAAVLEQSFAQLRQIAELNFHRAFYLASPSIYGAAREAALKMTEMTAGRVITVAETYLGLRHGPMSALDTKSLIVGFLSSDTTIRAYECDLLQELTDKGLGIRKVLVGSDVPKTLLQPGEIAIEHPAFASIGDDSAAILHVVVGQVLALFRSLHEGLQPDAPSEAGVITRVVQKFRLQGAAALST